MIGFGFSSDWMKQCREFFEPINERGNAKPKKMWITFHTQMKTALETIRTNQSLHTRRFSKQSLTFKGWMLMLSFLRRSFWNGDSSLLFIHRLLLWDVNVFLVNWPQYKQIGLEASRSLSIQLREILLILTKTISLKLRYFPSPRNPPREKKNILFSV